MSHRCHVCGRRITKIVFCTEFIDMFIMYIDFKRPTYCSFTFEKNHLNEGFVFFKYLVSYIISGLLGCVLIMKLVRPTCCY